MCASLNGFNSLERHVPVELRVSGPIHLPHAAFTDLGGDGVGAESGADFESHRLGGPTISAPQVFSDSQGAQHCDKTTEGKVATPRNDILSSFNEGEE